MQTCLIRPPEAVLYAEVIGILALHHRVIAGDAVRAFLADEQSRRRKWGDVDDNDDAPRSKTPRLDSSASPDSYGLDPSVTGGRKIATPTSRRGSGREVGPKDTTHHQGPQIMSGRWNANASMPLSNESRGSEYPSTQVNTNRRNPFSAMPTDNPAQWSERPTSTQLQPRNVPGIRVTSPSPPSSTSDFAGGHSRGIYRRH